VIFTNGSTGTEPLSYEWDFGDGATSTEENPTHAYAAEGDYTVTLSVSSPWGSDQASTVIHVGVAPEAAFSYSPKSPLVGKKVFFTNESTGTEPLSYEWQDHRVAAPVVGECAQRAHPLDAWRRA